MPPSPALRCSPSRELRGDNHKRGRSFESGMLVKEKDDDLALFNEMHSRERDNFLLQSSDDFEDTFSTKLKHFSDFKLGISIPVRGETSELLNVDGEKNDYDWLLTPPDTPLFPSLDDEPPTVTTARRGRPRSQPISISRSSTMEKSYRSSRGSASPNRLSPSPRSTSGTFQSRGRPSSAPQSSPTPSVRAATPTRRPSPPPNKPSTPAPGYLTPTPRRASTGSSTAASTGVRGSSPIRTSRGNSASPKISAWRSNIPGFSLDAPPNLRTSLTDRPASYVRGSSPASRNGKDSAIKYGRHSMSPTASRSVSSSQSHDRDRFSSQSKGSMASSGDDEIDSINSVRVRGSNCSVSKRVGAFPNNRAPAFSKKSSRLLTPSSAPKRSFDSILRQTDQRKSPPNMFRPLLSSVPSTTFYVGKGSSANRSLISRNSSVTTSSNASSDQGTSAVLDTEGSDHHQDDLTSEFEIIRYSDAQEVFAFDKVDALSEEAGHDRDDRSPNIQLDDFHQDAGNSQEFSAQGANAEICSTSTVLCSRGDSREGINDANMEICSKCQGRFCITEPPEVDSYLCPACKREHDLMADTVSDTIIAVEDSSMLSVKTYEENKLFDEMEPAMPETESLPQGTELVEPVASQPEENVKQGHTSFSEKNQNYLQENYIARSLAEGIEERLNYQEGTEQPTVCHSLPVRDIEGQRLQLSNEHVDLKFDSSEGAGISVLLKRSSSSKGHVVQGRTFTATTRPYDDASYARDSSSSLRSSTGYGSVSASSSIDFSARQTESRVQRQLSGKKFEIENCRYEMNLKPQSILSSGSGVSPNALQALGLATGTADQNVEVSAGNIKCNAVEEMHLGSEVKVPALENKTAAVALEADISDCDESTKSIDPSTSELSSHMVSNRSEDNSVASFLNYESYVSYENLEDFPNPASSALGATTITAESSREEHAMPDSSLDGVEVREVSGISSLAMISEIKTENCYLENPGSLRGDESLELNNNINEVEEPSVPTTDGKDMATSVQDLNAADNAHDILDESRVLVECRGGSKGRSLTLEEATDTILFCSSIVHDLAYKAASIAIEKETEVPLEGSWPTVTILGKSNTDRTDQPGRTAAKRSSKSLKSRPRRVETDAEPPPSKTENDENIDASAVRNVGLPNKPDSTKPQKLESKCNCTIM